MTKVTFYPGCSLDSTARDYRESMEEAFSLLGFELAELEDWNCCGATSAHSVDEELATLLPARNLAIASASTDLMVVPCAACYSRQKRAEVELAADADLKARVEETLGRQFVGEVSAINILDFLARDLDIIKNRIKSTLTDLKVVCYYGCLLTRPPKVTGEPSYEDPQSMDDIVRALGATPLQWSYKTECCGASHSIARGDLVHHLVARIFTMAREAGAQAVVTACPLCQMNLDARQKGSEAVAMEEFGIPVLYITELISAALGSTKIGKFLKGHFVGSADVTRILETV